MSYCKLDSNIVRSSIWTEDHATFKVWIALLAMKDQDGEVKGSNVGMARIVGVTVEEFDCAIQKFTSPDPHSSSTEFEGRRVQLIERGWLVLNHEKFRELDDEMERKAKNAKRQRRYEERCKERQKRQEASGDVRSDKNDAIQMQDAKTHPHPNSHSNVHEDVQMRQPQINPIQPIPTNWPE